MGERTDANRGQSLAVGFVAVLASMAALFLLPTGYFVAATILSMTVMMVVTYLVTRYTGLFKPRPVTVAAGALSALGLYFLFYLGNSGISTLHPFGLSASSENSIYSLIASPSNPLYLQVGVLAFDAAGYESFFRGVLQTRMEPRFGTASPFLVAAMDATIHLLTLNPLWVITTFIADLWWGLTYHYSKDLTSNTLSHFLWDVAIFVLFPIR